MPTPRILIVDDHAELRKLMALTLGDLNCDLVEAVDGPSALAECERQVPDLILLDVILPGGMDGIEICRHLRQDPQFDNTRIVLLTAADEDHRSSAASIGVDRLLSKPFSLRKLPRLVESLLAGDETE